MKKFISQSELEKQKTDNKSKHNVGEIYPQIFTHDKGLKFSKNMQLDANIIWLGSYLLENSLFPKIKCPLCGKEDVLIPYKVVGSILSGCHTIQFYCVNCQEKFVTNNYIEYFRLIYKYIQTNKNNFKTEDILQNCTTCPPNAEFV